MNTNQLQMLFRRQFFYAVLILSLFTLTLSACELQSQSPDALADLESGSKTWIEYPPEGEIFGEGAIPIVVYAASPDGVESISVSVGGQSVSAGELMPLVNDNTLVRTDLLWQPPAQGEYTILAAAGGGAPASLRFCVVTCETPETEGGDQPEATPTPTATLPLITLAPDEPTWTATATPTPANTNTPTPTEYLSATPTATLYASPTPTATLYPSSTPTEVSYTEPSADFWAAPSSINQGECTTLSWNVYGDFQAVYFVGNPVNGSGSDSECPAESYTYHLQVVDMYGSSSDYWASVDVAAAPADTSGPSINWTNLVWESCQFYGEAGISDESGVAWAQFYFNKNGEGWASVWMSELSADYWQSEVGISVDDGMGTPMGTIEYYVIAGDTMGNESESSTLTYDYMGCDG